MILEHAIYDVYNNLIQRKSIKKDEVQSGARSLSIFFFFGLQEDRLANMTNHYASDHTFRYVHKNKTYNNGFIFKDT